MFSKVEELLSKIQSQKSERKQRKKQQRKAYLAITFVFAGIILLTFIIIFIFLYLIVVKTTFVDLFTSGQMDRSLFIFLTVIISLITGYSLTLCICRLILKPLRKIIQSMEALANGHYETRLHFRGPIANLATFTDFTSSFNKMAEELEHTDSLSNDFINNFSHEFKTPIVSIEGFAKLLKNGNLDTQQQLEYLTIIEEESKRLATMASNILNLSKIESQTILTGQSKFNISEQIRNCFIILENKWSTRNLDFQLEFDEFTVTANEELLKQVWVNLLDNAIKYTPENEVIRVDIKQNYRSTIITVTNTGSEIPPEHQKYIFNKFYQTDKSHSDKGNGIGLAVVKKIVSLHNGTINVVSGNKKTLFIVTLPNY